MDPCGNQELWALSPKKGLAPSFRPPTETPSLGFAYQGHRMGEGLRQPPAPREPSLGFGKCSWPCTQRAPRHLPALHAREEGRREGSRCSPLSLAFAGHGHVQAWEQSALAGVPRDPRGEGPTLGGDGSWSPYIRRTRTLPSSHATPHLVEGLIYITQASE